MHWRAHPLDILPVNSIMHKFRSLTPGFSSIMELFLRQPTELSLVHRCSNGSLRGISSRDYSESAC